MNAIHFFEIYVRHPETGEPGWDIKTGYVVNASDRQDAEFAIAGAFGQQFDAVIQCYAMNPNRDDRQEIIIDAQRRYQISGTNGPKHGGCNETRRYIANRMRYVASRFDIMGNQLTRDDIVRLIDSIADAISDAS